MEHKSTVICVSLQPCIETEREKQSELRGTRGQFWDTNAGNHWPGSVVLAGSDSQHVPSDIVTKRTQCNGFVCGRALKPSCTSLTATVAGGRKGFSVQSSDVGFATQGRIHCQTAENATPTSAGWRTTRTMS